MLQVIGEIMHRAYSGRLIIQLYQNVPDKIILCDEKGTPIAKIAESIGPVNKPIASAIPLTNRIKSHEGDKVYASIPSSSTTNTKRRRK